MSGRSFIATISYDVSPQASEQARKLLLAEMVGRRWLQECKGRKLPTNTLWCQRTVKAEATTRTVFHDCTEDLKKAVSAVRRSGREMAVRRVWVQVSGAGSYGVAAPEDVA